MKQFIDKLTELKACDGKGQAMPWVREQPDVETAYKECYRGDWMLWYIYYSDIALQDKRKWIGCKIEIVRQVQHLMKDERSIKALEVGERYSKGEATDEELKQADDDAYAAYVYAAAADTAAAYAAYTAVAAYDAAWDKPLAKSADIVRKWYSLEEILHGLQG